MSLPEKFVLEKPQIKHNFTLSELKEKIDELQELILDRYKIKIG